VAAWEPDGISRKRLEDWMATLPATTRAKIRVSPDATGSAPGEVSFASSGTPASAVGAGSERVRVVTLDDALGDFAPTFIKMDIEGAELGTLQGARRTIATHRPILTVCTYHIQDDLWKIPLELARQERYTFALRPHLLEVWELVTYAVPAERLRA
jgi:FkbM family methyltransferase